MGGLRPLGRGLSGLAAWALFLALATPAMAQIGQPQPDQQEDELRREQQQREQQEREQQEREQQELQQQRRRQEQLDQRRREQLRLEQQEREQQPLPSQRGQQWRDWWQQPGQQPLQPGAQPWQLPPPYFQQPPSTIPSVPRPAPIDIGLRPTKLFELRWGAHLSEDYSDNFNLAASKPVTNFRTTLGPRALFLIHGAHVEGLLLGQGGVAWDSSSTEFSYFPNVSGQVTVEATPHWTLGASGSFTRSDSAAQTNRLGIQPTRDAYTNTSLGLTSTYALSTLAFRQSYQYSGFNQDQGQSNTTQTLGAGASVILGQINTLSLDYTYLHNESEAAPTGTTTGSASSSNSSSSSSLNSNFSINSGGGQKSHVDGSEIGVSFIREMTPRFTGGVSVNYAWRTSVNEATSNQPRTTTDFTRYGGTVFSTFTLPSLIVRGSAGMAILQSGSSNPKTGLSSLTSITYLLGPLTLAGSAESGFSESFNGGQDFGIVKTQSVNGSLSYALTPKMGASVGASYRKNEQTGVAGGQSGSNNRVWTGNAMLTWQAREWLALGLEYIYTKNEPLNNNNGTSSSSSSTTTTGSTTNNSSQYQENHARFTIGVNF